MNSKSTSLIGAMTVASTWDTTGELVEEIAGSLDADGRATSRTLRVIGRLGAAVPPDLRKRLAKHAPEVGSVIAIGLATSDVANAYDDGGAPQAAGTLAWIAWTSLTPSGELVDSLLFFGDVAEDTVRLADVVGRLAWENGGRQVMEYVDRQAQVGSRYANRIVDTLAGCLKSLDPIAESADVRDRQTATSD